jgi:hypothetical protein
MNLTEVNKSIQNNLFLQETAQQLEKDFLMIGINFDIDTPVSDYKHLFSFTYHLVNALNEQNPQKVLILIYRIDLAEKKVQEEMQKTQLSFTEMLSEMIVKREIYKVILRKKYS